MTDGRRKQRTNYPTKVPGIPKPPSDASPSLQRYLTSLSEALEIRLGRKGDIRDRAITLRELIDSGLASELANAPYDPNRPGNDFSGGGSGLVQLPTAPTNFTAIGAFSTISVTWDYPGYQYSGHSYTEVWRHTADVLSAAQLIGVSPGRAYIDYIGGGGGTFYYWGRHVNVTNEEGPYNANAGTLAQTQPDITFLLALLTDEITSTQLVQALRTPIEKVPLLDTFVGFDSQYTGDSLQTRMGDVEIIAGNAATSAQLLTEQTTRANADGAIASDVTTVQATIYNLDGNGNPNTSSPRLNATAVNSVVAEVYPNGTANASSVETLQTEVFNQNGTPRLASNQVVNQIETDLETVEQQYTVKLSQTSASGNTYITGYGLATEDVDGEPTSAFVVAADKFAVIDTATYTGGQTNDPNAYVPFVVVSTATTLQGQAVPAGVYIDTAWINKGRVLDLVAGSVVADFIQATAALDAPVIFGGAFNIGSINKHGSTDPRNWTVSGSNRVSNFSVDTNGIMHANAAKVAALTVYPTQSDLAADSNAILDSNGLNGTYIKNASVDTLQIAGNAITVPEGFNSSINTTLGASFTKLGELTINYGNASHTPSGVIITAGVQVSGNGSTNQTITTEVRRVYTNNTYSGQQTGESVRSDFGNTMTIGAQFGVAQVGSATTFKVEVHAKVSTGTRTATRVFISALASKR